MKFNPSSGVTTRLAARPTWPGWEGTRFGTEAPWWFNLTKQMSNFKEGLWSSR